MLKIGSLKLQSNLILAPMAGVSDLPFRKLNHKFGCELAFVEMINARCLGHKSKKTAEILRTDKIDKPLGMQLLGCEPAYIERAMDVLVKYNFDLLDFNAACPERKVTRRGEGASLLQEPGKLAKLLKIVVKRSSVPVTVKIRTGYDKDCINAPEVAQYAQDAGVKAIFIHGRTKQQLYSGAVDYETIRKVKKAVNVPVIGSGDVFSGELAKKLFDGTGCDGITVARGALGNPWIFEEIRHYLKTGQELPKPGMEEIIRTMLEHLDFSVDFFGPKYGVVIFRKFFGWYTKGFRKIRPLRETISRLKTRKDVEEVINQICLIRYPRQPGTSVK
ncbi:MAG: tRNA dihydrouridine synthase DusB [Candidatus Omnitrophica bacterium]|nr:tRNA dihydrouridine synthase DusB [Candidatus Omnitrophota bacterium]